MWWGLGEDLAMLSGRARVGLLLLLEGSFMHESLVVVRCRVILVRFLCGILFFFSLPCFFTAVSFDDWDDDGDGFIASSSSSLAAVLFSLSHGEMGGEKELVGFFGRLFPFHVPTVTSLACLFFLGGLMKLGLFY